MGTTGPCCSRSAAVAAALDQQSRCGGMGSGDSGSAPRQRLLGQQAADASWHTLALVHREPRWFASWKHHRCVEQHRLPREITEITGQECCPFGDGGGWQAQKAARAECHSACACCCCGRSRRFRGRSAAPSAPEVGVVASDLLACRLCSQTTRVAQLAATFGVLRATSVPVQRVAGLHVAAALHWSAGLRLLQSCAASAAAAPVAAARVCAQSARLHRPPPAILRSVQPWPSATPCWRPRPARSSSLRAALTSTWRWQVGCMAEHAAAALGISAAPRLQTTGCQWWC